MNEVIPPLGKFKLVGDFPYAINMPNGEYTIPETGSIMLGVPPKSGDLNTVIIDMLGTNWIVETQLLNYLGPYQPEKPEPEIQIKEVEVEKEVPKIITIQDVIGQPVKTIEFNYE